MKHIQTLNGATLKASAAKGGCGECQTSCQSALQDFLHGRQPEVREPVILRSLEKGRCQPALFHLRNTRPGWAGRKEFVCHDPYLYRPGTGTWWRT